MPWYDVEDDFELEPAQGTVPLTGSQIALKRKNPYTCTLEMTLPPEEVPRLKSLYSPLLQWIDPAFNLIQIEQEDNSTPSFYHDKDQTEKVQETHFGDHLNTQSLSIVLFLNEESGCQLNARFAKSYLESPPWVFHHKIELTSRTDMRSVARQDYYESSPDLPLWTVCSVHYGNEQLRFNIFAKHFEEMKKFYRVLTRTEASASKPGFCTFDLYSQPGLDIKLSLKHSPFLQPYPPKRSTLKFSVPDVFDIETRLSLTLTSNGDNSWLARDPDGNVIILTRDETEWCEECLREIELTEVSDSGQWSETPSEEDSSWDMCSESDCEDYSCESGRDSICFCING